MKEACSLKDYAKKAKARMLKAGDFPTFVGVVPLRKYDVLMAEVQSNDLLCKMCKVVESGNDYNPLTYLIDKDKFNNMSMSERERYMFRLAEAYKCVKQLYKEMEIKNKISDKMNV